MTLEKILDYEKNLIKRCVSPDDYVIDATCGNGHDTLFLASLVTQGGVFGFDIQQVAIENTKSRLKEAGLSNFTLYNTGHENALKVIPEAYHGKIAACVFNLGYLPHGDKSITTKVETTLQGIDVMLSILKPGGLLTIVVYPGHTEGKKEEKALLDYLGTLDQKSYQVLLYRFINQINEAPFLIVIEKL